MKSRHRRHGVSRFAYRCLTKRYLLWMYKTTKDELDRIDRKFTQLEVDRFIADYFLKVSGRLNKKRRDALSAYFRQWDEYTGAKEKDAESLKYVGPGELEPRYAFMHLKLEAILRAVRRYLGPGSIKEFQRLYEAKAIENILCATSERR